jgi:hypothetical protein
MSGFHYIVIGLCLLLLLWLLVQEVRRPGPSLLALRVLAVVMAVVALACLALPLGHFRERPVAEVHARSGVEKTPAGIVAVNWRRRLGKG